MEWQGKFRRITSKKKFNYFIKTIDKWRKMWYNNNTKEKEKYL